MRLLGNGKVNIVITNRVLRYTYHKNSTLEGLVTYGEVELPKDTIKDGTIENKSIFLEVVNQLVHQHKWKRKKLNFCVPDDTVVIRKLTIPASLTNEEAMGYVKTQFGNSFYLPFSNPAITIEFLEDEDDSKNILLFAYPKEKITAFEDVFEEAGLKPVVADLTSLSVYRYYYLHKPDGSDHVLLIHWNHDALVLTVFHQHKAVFTRYMKTAAYEEGTEINEDRAKQVIDEFIIEIKRIIDFYQFSITKGEETINVLLLSGDFPFLSTVKSTISKEITIPIHKLHDEKISTKYIDVLGLAMKRDG